MILNNQGWAGDKSGLVHDPFLEGLLVFQVPVTGKKVWISICLGHQEMYWKGHFSIPFLNLSWQCMEIWPLLTHFQ